MTDQTFPQPNAEQHVKAALAERDNLIGVLRDRCTALHAYVAALEAELTSLRDTKPDTEES